MIFFGAAIGTTQNNKKKQSPWETTKARHLTPLSLNPLSLTALLTVQKNVALKIQGICVYPMMIVLLEEPALFRQGIGMVISLIVLDIVREQQLRIVRTATQSTPIKILISAVRFQVAVIVCKINKGRSIPIPSPTPSAPYRTPHRPLLPSLPYLPVT